MQIKTLCFLWLELAKLPKTTLYVSPEAQVSGQTYKFSAWNGTFGTKCLMQYGTTMMLSILL